MTGQTWHNGLLSFDRQCVLSPQDNLRVSMRAAPPPLLITFLLKCPQLAAYCNRSALLLATENGKTGTKTLMKVKRQVSHVLWWLCSMEASDTQAPSISLLHRCGLYFKVPHGPRWLLWLKTGHTNFIPKKKAKCKN